MKFTRTAGVAVLAVVALVGSGLAAGATTQGSDTPPADEIGITDDEIRLAVLADVDTPVQPGLFQAAVDTMRAWAKYVNKQGGVAGRKIVIDFTDTKLSPNEARDGVIKACSDDFAMVGGEALFLNNVDDMVACVDKQGNATGLPNMPGLALDVAERCAPTTYITNGDTAFCATKDEHPQTYTSQVGDARYYLRKFGDLHGVFTVPADLKATKNSMSAYFEAMVDEGIERDAEGFYDTSAMAPQSALTPIIQAAKNSGSTIVYNGNALGTMVLLRREAKLQGLDTVKVWACNQGCYDSEFLEQGGGDVEGTHTVITALPFYTEYKSNPVLKAVVKDLGGIDKMNANSMSSLVAAILFQEAAEKAVADSGTLTRQSLLDALGSMTAFDAEGLIGPTDISTHQPPVCIVIAQVKNGKWVREFPKKAGTFDCNKKNLAVHQLDLT
jgi:ABC-type branched-subunit amino acid transport system substrate-binding protein